MTRVTVVGAGKMGLPIACQIARNGATVSACDLNAALVTQINQGTAPFDEPGLTQLLSSVVERGALRATTDLASVAGQSDVIIVIVPVLLTPERQADLAPLRVVARRIGETMRPGTMVIFETTLPVGATRSLLPLLECGGRVAGQDFDLVFSPERVKSRLVLKHLSTTPKVVGGHSPAAASRAEAFYRQYLQAPVLNVGSLESAELVKLAGMVYRDVNIALANELARYAETLGVDFSSVAAAANTDGEAALLLPGIGVGGHCTPVYPHFLARDAAQRGSRASLTETARAVNDGQAEHAVARLESHWASLEGRHVLLLGLAFRPEVKEHICSPAYLLRDALRLRRAQVELYDPMYSAAEIADKGFVPGRLDAPVAPDAIILVTAHRALLELDFAGLASKGLEAVVDGRNAWNAETARQAGLVYLGVGRAAVADGPQGGEPGKDLGTTALRHSAEPPLQREVPLGHAE